MAFYKGTNLISGLPEGCITYDEEDYGFVKKNGEYPLYSNDERVVGTYNGEVVYEKTYSATGLSANSRVIVDSSINSNTIKYIVNIDGAIKSNGSWFFQRQVTNSNTMYTMEYAVASDGIRIEVSNQTVTDYFLTIRYIKK